MIQLYAQFRCCKTEAFSIYSILVQNGDFPQWNTEEREWEDQDHTGRSVVDVPLISLASFLNQYFRLTSLA
jgi:hypothetical protein